jgi:hypothetical protein
LLWAIIITFSFVEEVVFLLSREIIDCFADNEYIYIRPKGKNSSVSANIIEENRVDN